MGKEIKEKCKECAYYNDKQQYPDVEGATTHLNCLSLKCQYRKITKDMQISRLKHNLADLEAKLAESEKEKNYYQDLYFTSVKGQEKLKQQLAEKEKEIESLRENSLSKRIFKEKLIPSHCMEQYEKYEQQIDKLTQDKISFAVEQLEQTRKEFEIKFKGCKWEDKMLVGKFCNITNEIIDNQIKQLKVSL